MQLLDVKFGPLAHPAPQNRAALLMHFEHVPLRFFAWITKHLLKNHRHVSHQIDRIVVHDDLPGKIDRHFGSGLFLKLGILNRSHCGTVCSGDNVIPSPDRQLMGAKVTYDSLGESIQNIVSSVAQLKEALLPSALFRRDGSRRSLELHVRFSPASRALRGRSDAALVVEAAQVEQSMHEIQLQLVFQGSAEMLRACRRAVSTLMKISPC